MSADKKFDAILEATGNLGDAMVSAGCPLQMVAKGYILTASSLIVLDRYGDAMDDAQHSSLATRLAVHLIDAAREFTGLDSSGN